MKKRQPPKHPGEVLQRARWQAELAEDSLARRLKVEKAQIKAIEKWQLEQLPDLVYLEPILKKFAQAVDIKYSDLKKDFAGSFASARRPVRSQKKNLKRTFVLSRISFGLAMLSIVVVVFSYLLWQGSVLSGAPKLEILSPQDGIRVTNSVQTLAGNTSQGSQIYINGSPVLVDPDGSFQTEVFLNDGLNELEITAINSLSNETTASRTVILD